ncbi:MULTISPECIES: hypothetical protein [Anaerotignum]|uniref:hypothetical protein n=1 Tax=Anaerotignum TaxID=2039240 RepID=UPI00210DE679|nr:MULTISPECIES: hypothetical protein [Anaerotignum]MCQ4935558.1 hypothetical protein [Anaerotignum propionicum]
MRNKRNDIRTLTIISILLSPLFGGLIGRFVGFLNILNLPHIYLDAGLCYLGAIAWIVASLLFYFTYEE